MNPLISEAERRWADFQGGRAITLPDGQVWEFYEPEAVMRGNAPGWTFGSDVVPDVDFTLSTRFCRVIAKWRNATNDANRASVVLEAAWFLLARNYDVTAEEFEAVLNQASSLSLNDQLVLSKSLRSLVDDVCNRAMAIAGVV